MRNAASAQATGDWLCFLDADDELDVGFMAAMERVEREEIRGHGCYPFVLLPPAVSYVVKSKHQAAKFWPEVALEDGNWLVIGTLIPRPLFELVAGFREWPLYEDWDLFARCWKEGAQIVKVPDAVYVAHWRPDSRNKSLGRRETLQAHYDIGRDLFPERYDEAWLGQHLRNIPYEPRRERMRTT